jgi:hypothetical protein
MLRNKILMTIIFFMVSSNVFAKNNTNALADYEPGLYVGLQGGVGMTRDSWPEEFINYDYGYLNPSSRDKNITKRNSAGRLFLGYSFIPNISLETGFSFFPINSYSIKGTFVDVPTQTLDYKFKMVYYAYDFVVKGTIRLEEWNRSLRGWSVYAKIGYGLAHTKFTSENYNEGVTSIDSNSSVIVGGLGIGYNFTDKLGVDLSYTDIGTFWGKSYANTNHSRACSTAAGVCNTHSIGGDYTPRARMWALGLIYKF